MKYLYFDCFAGFTPVMAAGALADMLGADLLFAPFTGLFADLTETKRAGMEAKLVSIYSKQPNEMRNRAELLKYTENWKIGSACRELLKKWIDIRAEAISVDPDDAVFFFGEEISDLASVAMVGEALVLTEAEKIYISNPLCSDGEGLFGPVTTPETTYICKKYNIQTRSVVSTNEFLTVSGAALIAALEAVFAPSVMGNIIKIGYGAGEYETEDMPNLVRVVLGCEDEGDQLKLESEQLFEEAEIVL